MNLWVIINDIFLLQIVEREWMLDFYLVLDGVDDIQLVYSQPPGIDEGE